MRQSTLYSQQDLVPSFATCDQRHTVSNSPHTLDIPETRKISSLFTLAVKVDSLDFPMKLVKADVVEALKTGPVDGFNTVVRDQKLLLPSHEDNFFLCWIPDLNAAHVRVSGVGFELVFELGPVVDIDLAICSPLRIFRDEAMMWTDDFAFKICRQCRVGVSKT